ncbi:unnamed protein product [Musa acuminata subsp. malaccensis]|uniref:(wild Malaysian banana) hypothetical protein n=1 Tax=Musa acuminata subsp. malaccensis TaxID=214687 RepID=A0A804IQK5_MUSAM|nr:unnamed protein product [Musa acuminata subsp. malaccensis]
MVRSPASLSKHLDRDSVQLLRGLVGPIIASIYKGGGTHVQGLVYRGAGCICFLGSGRLPLSLLFCGKVKPREGREVVSRQRLCHVDTCERFSVCSGLF